MSQPVPVPNQQQSLRQVDLTKEQSSPPSKFSPDARETRAAVLTEKLNQLRAAEVAVPDEQRMATDEDVRIFFQKYPGLGLVQQRLYSGVTFAEIKQAITDEIPKIKYQLAVLAQEASGQGASLRPLYGENPTGASRQKSLQPPTALTA